MLQDLAGLFRALNYNVRADIVRACGTREPQHAHKKRWLQQLAVNQAEYVMGQLVALGVPESLMTACISEGVEGHYATFHVAS
mmetsp:Transcript_76312/g.241325  ORF Transcript_76312/g.241325 Transcript_76312/m.241325 type:complete len:83 (-) Transcript_76312:180-428(-)